MEEGKKEKKKKENGRMKTRVHGTAAISLCSAHEERMLDQAQQGEAGGRLGQRDLCLCMCASLCTWLCVCMSRHRTRLDLRGGEKETCDLQRDAMEQMY